MNQMKIVLHVNKKIRGEILVDNKAAQEIVGKNA
jgi:hypothetical protein